MKKHENHSFDKIKNDKSKLHEEDRTSLDNFKQQKLVDDIPMEDLKINKKMEKQKKKTQNTSQSEKKFKEKN